MIILTAVLLTVGILLYTIAVRGASVPATEPPSPLGPLEERKAAIYENLRDLQFEYLTGKLSDKDYQQTKQDLQRELAAVAAEADQLRQKLGRPGIPEPAAAAVAKSPAPAPAQAANVCPHCGASFPQPLKFCGECGRPMAGGRA